jgi:antitoxin component YwqK of YwqJK toxin-antitoxin module
MKQFILLLLLFLTILGCQKEVTSDQVIFDKASNKVVLKNSGNKPFSGKVLHHNEDGLLEYELIFKKGENITNNLKLGFQSLCKTSKEPYEDYWDLELDTLKVFISDFYIPFSGIYIYNSKTDTLFNFNDYNFNTEITYKDGKKNGVLKYFENDLLRVEVMYKDNNLHGTSKSFNDKSVLMNLSNYLSGKLSGTSTSYHNNGKIKSEVNYENGIIVDDEVIEYYDSGNKKSNKQYKSGKINGEWTFWKKDGSLLDNGKFQNGNGVIKEYYDNNQLKFEANYTNDKYNGFVLEYSENGSLAKKENYVNGLLNDERLLYFDNGKLKEKANYVMGKIEGKKTEYFESGVLKEKTEYKNGKKNGWQLTYDEKGKLKYDFYFVNDKYEYKEYKKINPKIKQSIKYIQNKLEKYDKNYDRSSKPYSAHVRAYFQFKNLTNKKIVAIKFDFCFKDVFGDILYDSSAKYDLNLQPGKKNPMDMYWYWEDSYLSPYKKLWSPVESGNVKTEVTITKIVFSDGSIIE